MIDFSFIYDNGVGTFGFIIIVLILSIFLERSLRKFLNHHFLKSSKHIKVDHTQFTVLKHVLSALIYLFGIGTAIYMIPPLKALSVSLFASAGILAVIIGFASQKAFSNIVSGIFIAIFKPFRVGDLIKFQDKIGRVEDITLRHTILRNFENKRWIVPNSVISDEIIENANIEDERTCRWVEIGISYDADIDKAIKIIQEEAMKHPLWIDPRTENEKIENKPAVDVRVIGFGDSSVNLKAWCWASGPIDAFKLGTDLNKNIKERFDKEGIEIPFPYRTIVYKKDIKKKKR